MNTGSVSERTDSRTAILGVALRLFLSQGYDRTTVEDIAREAGSSRATIFRHFKSKEDIVFRRYDLALEESLRQLRTQKGSPVRRVRAVVLELAETLEADGETFRSEVRLMARNNRLGARALLTMFTWGAMVAQELADENDDPSDHLATRVTAQTAVAALEEAIRFWQEQPGASLVDLTREALATAIPAGRRIARS